MYKCNTMLRRIRIGFAAAFLILITLLFIDPTGRLHHYFGFMAQLQFIPALLALNFAIVIAILLLTLVLGRVYCSVICPLGVLQDVFSNISGRFNKNRFNFKKGNPYLRYGFLIVLIVLWGAGLSVVLSLFEPYSAYGRIASQLLRPITEPNAAIYILNEITLSVAIFTFLGVGLWAWFKGRGGYCNTLCPVGSILGLVSKYSFLKPVIQKETCVGCGVCASKCKASCIDPIKHTVDLSRCVACMDCLDSCSAGAIKLTKSIGSHKSKTNSNLKNPDRRRFLFTTGTTIGAAAMCFANNKLAPISGGLTKKLQAKRHTPILPPGAYDIKRFEKKCTACQLCVSSCPEKVLKPSPDLSHFMQPVVEYERGSCNINCTTCSEVCPTEALLKIKPEEKKNLQIGKAVYIEYRCVITTDYTECGNCAQACPTGAIKMLAFVKDDPNSLYVPSIDTSRCIGCGKCEYVCPTRPHTAIYVEGVARQRTI